MKVAFHGKAFVEWKAKTCWSKGWMYNLTWMGVTRILLSGIFYVIANTLVPSTIISSAYFLGAVLGLAISSLLFDKFGRLFVLKISQVLSLILNICVIFPQGVEYMMVLRTLLGAAYFISNNGLLMIAVEFVPLQPKSSS